MPNIGNDSNTIEEGWLRELGAGINPKIDITQNSPNEAVGLNVQPSKEPDPNAMFAEVFDRTLQHVQHLVQGEPEETNNKDLMR